MAPTLNYGNWIRKRLLVYLGLAALALGALSLLPLGTLYRLVFGLLTLAALVSFLFPLYAYNMFSPRGGRLQAKVYALIVRHLGPGAGRLLDIGAGNGVLSAQLAASRLAATVVGVDRWDANWEYSKTVCEQNAQALGVASRVTFQKGDAAALDFADATFDGVVSNLTFHEVRAVADKRLVLREALRVLKPGGAFAFVDYFAEPKHYGAPAAFQAYLQGLGLQQVEYAPLASKLDLSLPLRHPKILGRVALVWGRK